MFATPERRREVGAEVSLDHFVDAHGHCNTSIESVEKHQIVDTKQHNDYVIIRAEIIHN